MLAIISDLHLTDGTTGVGIKADAFRVFRERMSDMAYDASWRKGGKYKPIEKLDLVLLGDVLDVIRSTDWTAGGSKLRPWDNSQSQEYIQKIETITNNILKENTASLQVLKKLSQENSITIPPATRKGIPARVSRDPRSTQRAPVKVNIHYMTGNHDWFYHLSGPEYDQIRQRIIEKMGLVNSSGPFPHDLSESGKLQTLFDEHAVYGRHGDIYDPFNYDPEKGRDHSSLGDAMVVELFNEFPDRVAREMGDELPKVLLHNLMELGSVTPSLLAPVWIDSSLHRYHGVTDAQRKKIDDIWDDLSDEFLENDFVQSKDKMFAFDAVDALKLVLKLSRGFTFNKVSELLLRFKAGIKSDSSFSFANHVFEEKAFQERTAKYFVYGHTHGYEVVPLDSSIKNKRYFEQLYINSGTWHPMYTLARKDPKNKKFISYSSMTYLAFYKEDERRGFEFDTWSGIVGPG